MRLAPKVESDEDTVMLDDDDDVTGGKTLTEDDVTGGTTLTVVSTLVTCFGLVSGVAAVAAAVATLLESTSSISMSSSAPLAVGERMMGGDTSDWSLGS